MMIIPDGYLTLKWTSFIDRIVLFCIRLVTIMCFYPKMTAAQPRFHQIGSHNLSDLRGFQFTPNNYRHEAVDLTGLILSVAREDSCRPSCYTRVRSTYRDMRSDKLTINNPALECLSRRLALSDTVFWMRRGASRLEI